MQKWKLSSNKWKIDERQINLMDSDALLGCTQLFLERNGKRIRSFKVDLMHKDLIFFKEWEVIQEENGWMKIKNLKMDYYLELSNTGEPTVKSKLFVSALNMCWEVSRSKRTDLSIRDEFELEFSGSSEPELGRCRAEPSWGTLIFELKPS